jgi:hypothetical protein
MGFDLHLPSNLRSAYIVVKTVDVQDKDEPRKDEQKRPSEAENLPHKMLTVEGGQGRVSWKQKRIAVTQVETTLKALKYACPIDVCVAVMGSGETKGEETSNCGNAFDGCVAATGNGETNG